VYTDRDDSEDEQIAFKDEPLALALRKRPGRHKASQGPDHMTEKRAFLNFVPCFGRGTIQYRRYINFHRLASRSKRCARATSWPRRRARLGDCHGHGLPRPWTNRRISSAVSRLDIILPISSDGIASFRRTPNGTLGARLRTTAVTRAWNIDGASMMTAPTGTSKFRRGDAVMVASEAMPNRRAEK
jgi:hypothetical protein